MLMTVAQARQFDAARTDEERRDDALTRARNLGFTEKDFEAKERELERLRGERPAARDVFWLLSNEAIPDARRRGDWHYLSLVHWQRAQLLFDEGAPFLEERREASRAELRKYAGTRMVSRVRTIATGGCPACIALSRRSFSIEDALAELPAPVEACEHIFCRCAWAIGLDSA